MQSSFTITEITKVSMFAHTLPCVFITWCGVDLVAETLSFTTFSIHPFWTFYDKQKDMQCTRIIYLIAWYYSDFNSIHGISPYNWQSSLMLLLSVPMKGRAHARSMFSFIVFKYSRVPVKSRWIKRLIDCFGFYAVSAIFQPCNGGR